MCIDQPRKEFYCANGPFANQYMLLTTYLGRCASSCAFELHGERGRYIEDPIDGNLYWEKDHGSECPI